MQSDPHTERKDNRRQPRRDALRVGCLERGVQAPVLAPFDRPKVGMERKREDEKVDEEVASEQNSSFPSGGCPTVDGFRSGGEEGWRETGTEADVAHCEEPSSGQSEGADGRSVRARVDEDRRRLVRFGSVVRALAVGQRLPNVLDLLARPADPLRRLASESEFESSSGVDLANQTTLQSFDLPRVQNGEGDTPSSTRRPAG